MMYPSQNSERKFIRHNIIFRKNCIPIYITIFIPNDQEIHRPVLPGSSDF